MRILLLLLIGAIFLMSSPVFAQDWHMDSESVPYTAPNYTKMFPNMGMNLNKYPPPVQPPSQPIIEPTPSPVVGNPPQYIQPVVVQTVEPQESDMDWRMLQFIGVCVLLAIIVFGFVIPNIGVK